MAMWSPWRGCKKCSEGCKYCYIHKGDSKRNVNTNDIVKTENFDIPMQRNKKGEYRLRKALDYEWVLNIRNQCINKKVDFEFRQCGTCFIKDGKQYTLQVRDLMKQAKEANINIS